MAFQESKFNHIVIECSMGQKKLGVEKGGEVLINSFQNKANTIISYNKNISIWDNIQNSFDIIKTLGPNNIYYGGDHSIAISTISNTIYHYGNQNVFVIWIDAHADINSLESSLTGNVHGMPVYYLLKNYLKTGDLLGSNIVYIGIRDLDPIEWDIIKEYNIQYYTINDVKEKGIHNILNEINQKINQHKVHISFDVDSLDPNVLDSTGTTSPNGMNPNDVVEIIRYFKDKTVAYDITEFNPELGNLDKSLETIKPILNEINKLR